jgi:kynurenine formamidase
MTWDHEEYLATHRNWARWGATVQRGAVNLVTGERTRRAAGLVSLGEPVSLSRRTCPEQRHVSADPAAPGVATEYLAGDYHGSAVTHVDALCHAWSRHGMWGGRSPAAEIGRHGSAWADIANLRDGVVTRGVLLDVPAVRGEPFVALGRPVGYDDLCAAEQRAGLHVGSGDAVVLYCGRDAWEAGHGRYPGGPDGQRPGVGASCVRFVRERDAALLLWDMLEERHAAGVPFGPVHGVLWAFGVPLVDNCDLRRLVRRCRAERRYEFLLLLAPLVLPGGTGSPVNPLAVL